VSSPLGVVVPLLLLEVLGLLLLELDAQCAQVLDLRRQPVLARLDLPVDLLDNVRDLLKRLALDLIDLGLLLRHLLELVLGVLVAGEPAPRLRLAEE